MSVPPKTLEPRRTSDPATSPLTLAEAKAQMRIQDDDDDTLIQRLIDVATAKIDGWNGDLGRALITQTWRIEMNRFPGERRLDVLVGPVQSATVTYSDSDNAAQTFTDFAAHEDAAGPFLWLDESVDAWPDTFDRRDAVRIDVVAGYGDAASDIPEPVRHAMLLMLAHWYEHREQVIIGQAAAEIPMAAGALLTNFRKPAHI